MKESMRSKLKQIARRLEEIDAMLASPDVTSDMNRFRDLSRVKTQGIRIHRRRHGSRSRNA